MAVDDYLGQRALYRAKTGANQDGEPQFAADVSVKCRVQPRQVLTRTSTGDVRVAGIELFLLPSQACQVGDAFVVSGRQWRVLVVQDFQGRNGLSHRLATCT